MGNYIVANRLMSNAPSRLNRGGDGYIKNGLVGDTSRAMQSGATIKRSIGKISKLRKCIRTAHLQDIFDGCFKKAIEKMVEDGLVEDTEEARTLVIDELGNAACDATGCKWDNRKDSPKKKKGSDKKGKDDQNTQEQDVADASDDEEAKGNVVITITRDAVDTIVNALVNTKRESILIERENESLNEKDKKKVKSLKDAVKEALDNVRVSPEEALMGTMSTGKTMQSITGGAEIGHSFSINEFRPKGQFFSATFEKGDFDEKRGSFYDSVYNEFAASKVDQSNSETIGMNGDLSADVMYTSTCVDIGLVRRNLQKTVTGGRLPEREDALEVVKDTVSKWFTAFPNAQPEGGQHSDSSHPVASIVYFECIQDGFPRYPDAMFEQAIGRKEGSSISEQGIERILTHAGDDTFNLNPEGVTKYVLLPAQYAKYKDAFRQIGVTVIDNARELEDVIRSEVERLF